MLRFSNQLRTRFSGIFKVKAPRRYFAKTAREQMREKKVSRFTDSVDTSLDQGLIRNIGTIAHIGQLFIN